MDNEETCPICRSGTYLNPNMKFLLNKECYHKICESCVDRLFSTGPAPCPYKGCGKILRRQRFKTQVFEDLGVEKEVDARERVAKIYNRPESAFDSTREYDDYLEHIETLIFDIVNGTPEEKANAEKEVKEYEAKNHEEILSNALNQRQQQQLEEQIRQQEQERDRRLRLLAIELESQEREHKKLIQQQMVASLAAGRNSKDAINEATQAAQQRSEALRQEYERELENARQATEIAKSAHLYTEGQRTPFTPFNGDRDTFEFVQLDQYYDPLTANMDKDLTLRAGGFTAKFSEYGALAAAFMSLDIDVQTEKNMAPEPVNPSIEV